MESDGIFQLHLQQKGLVREYNSCGLEYFLGPYKLAIPRKAKIGQCDLYFALTSKSQIGH